MGFVGFYCVLLGPTGFYWVFVRFFWVSNSLYCGSLGFYWVLLDFTGFYWVLLGFTGIY